MKSYEGRKATRGEILKPFILSLHQYIDEITVTLTKYNPTYDYLLLHTSLDTPFLTDRILRFGVTYAKYLDALSDLFTAELTGDLERDKIEQAIENLDHDRQVFTKQAAALSRTIPDKDKHLPFVIIRRELTYLNTIPARLASIDENISIKEMASSTFGQQSFTAKELQRQAEKVTKKNIAR